MKFKIILFSLLLTFSSKSLAQSTPWDYKITYDVNHGYTTGGGKFFHFITETPTPVGLALPVGLFVTSWITKDKEMRIHSYENASTVILAGMITGALKYGLDRERPFVTYADINKHSTGGSPSFPSGHTTMAFATATSLCLAYPKWYVIVPSMLWAGSVGYSRMYLGVHYFTDVMAGALIGSGTAVGVYYASKWIQKKVRAKREQNLGLKL